MLISSGWQMRKHNQSKIRIRNFKVAASTSFGGPVSFIICWLKDHPNQNLELIIDYKHFFSHN